MNPRQQLLDALLVERFGTPTREYQPTLDERLAAADRAALIEHHTQREPLRIVEAS